MKRSIWAVLVALFVVVGLGAQAPPKDEPVLSINGKTVPTLSVEQQQAVQILVQRIELATLRAQAAQADFDKARTELAALLKALQRDGYDLDLQTFAYVKKPDPPPAEKKK
jgi:hypothetical protein